MMKIDFSSERIKQSFLISLFSGLFLLDFIFFLSMVKVKIWGDSFGKVLSTVSIVMLFLFILRIIFFRAEFEHKIKLKEIRMVFALSIMSVMAYLFYLLGIYGQ